MRTLALAAGLSLGAFLSSSTVSGTTSPTPITIYQAPLTVAIPAHPQVVLAVANSESMDGNLSGAIMAGSGSLSGANELQATTSPLNYTVPTGFTAPVNGGAAGTSQPYTVSVSGVLEDNSSSRLNVAKGGLINILNNFMPNTDFALMDYSTSGLQLASTWVYLMSPTGANFSVASSVPTTSRGVANPCYNVGTGTDAVQSECAQLASQVTNITTQPYLIIGASSDDPNINDVLYDWSGSIVPLCLVYSGPSPSTPFPPNYTLSNYESASVLEGYRSQSGGTCATETGPTNAGYVPYSPQVMYVKRGFGYWTSSESASSGKVLVSMQSVGTSPTSSAVSTALAKFTPYLQPETNNASSTEIKAAGTQSPTAGLLNGALTYLKTVTTSSNGCAATKYVVLITDGLPTMDLSGNNWPPLGSVSASGYSVTATFSSNGALSSTNDQALTDTINTITALNNAGIKTYVIGLGAGVNTSANTQAAATLTAMAVAGGTGAYFPATDPTTMANDLQVILAAIQAGTQSTATAAVNSTSIHTGSVIYQGQFTTSDTSQDWSGNLYAFPINASTGSVNTSASAALWSAQAQLDAQDPNSRIIATFDPVTGSGTPFRWTSGTPTSAIASSTTLGQELSGSAYDSSGSDALNFLRGVESLSYSNGGPYRARAHALGDIVDSAPLYVGGASGIYNSASYVSFAAQVVNRTPIIYVGANDGMLHAFSAATGQELFAYIPSGVFTNLLALSNRYYAENHQFYVDGSPAAGDVQWGGNWHTVLTGGEGGGGKSIYAIDVTNPASFTTESALSSAVLWDFTDSNMGLTYSRPVVATTNAGAVVLFGNGYDSPTQVPYFYALNAQTGAVLAKINLCAQVSGVCNTSVTNGLSSVTVANTSGDLAAVAAVAYAGDLQGNVWRIDISNANSANWTVSVLFQARDSSGNIQPITAAPAVTLNPSYPQLLGQMVYVGTGQMLTIADLSTTQLQTVYGIYDANSASSTPITRSQLVQQTMSTTTATSTTGNTFAARLLTSLAVSLPSKKGWFVDLSLVSGERAVTDPELDSGALIVTTTQPLGNTCTGGMNSWLNLFNYSTGGAFSTAQLSITNQVIAGLSLGAVYAAAPRIEIYDNNSISRAILVTESPTSSTSINNPVPIQDFTMYGRTLHRTAWTELR